MTSVSKFHLQISDRTQNVRTLNEPLQVTTTKNKHDEIVYKINPIICTLPPAPSNIILDSDLISVTL